MHGLPMCWRIEIDIAYNYPYLEGKRLASAVLGNPLISRYNLGAFFSKILWRGRNVPGRRVWVYGFTGQFWWALTGTWIRGGASHRRRSLPVLSVHDTPSMQRRPATPPTPNSPHDVRCCVLKEAVVRGLHCRNSVLDHGDDPVKSSTK